MKILLGYILALGVLFLACGILNAQTTNNPVALSNIPDRCGDGDFIYTVKPGDVLQRIASSFGSYRFWEIIYIANADRMANPNLIYPGQKINIPQNVANYHSGEMDIEAVLDSPFCESSKVPVGKVNNSYLLTRDIGELISRLEEELAIEEKLALETEETAIEAAEKKEAEVSDEQLEVFRELFSEVVQEEENVQKENEKQLLNLIDGMVYDETRSKIGKDFYDIFYSNWEPPNNATNFSIKITEISGPSLGAVVSVMINETEIFKTRLQPRYETIQDAGKYAVSLSYRYLAANQNQQIQIY